jgi:DNA-binding HxlR family transcriptional regulator
MSSRHFIVIRYLIYTVGEVAQVRSFICSLDAVMYMIGGKWKLFIVWYLKDGTKRFSELRKLIPHITQKMLTQQVRELERDKLVNRKVYAQIPPKVEYSLTETGKKLIPILTNLCFWAYDAAEINDFRIET